MSFRFLVLAPLETQFPNPKKSPKLEENVFPPIISRLATRLYADLAKT